jgi:hypothetical protein
VTRRRNPELTAVLAAAGVAHGEQDPRGERYERDLAAVLAAFNAADSDPLDGVAPGARAGASRPKRVPGRLAVKCAAALVIAAGGSVAAAGAGVLPSPVQQFAHHVLGGIGVPGPRKPGTGTAPSRGATSSATARAMATPRTTPAAVSGSPSAVSATSTVVETLCGTVVHAGNSWRSDVSKADRAILVAAAGSQQKVLAYCTSLLAGTSSAAATPSAASGATSAAATPAATKTHGNPHPSKTPKPTGTGN